MKVLGALVLACFAIFCYGQNTTTSSTTCPSAPLVVGTFNTELIITASGRQERMNAQINFFKNSTNLEILCLQELWDPQMRQNFINGLNSTFPYSYYPPNFPISNANCSVACSTTALQQTSQCLSTQNCFQNGNIGDQISCAFSGCRSTFENLDDTCRACLSVDRENNLDANIRFCTNSGIAARECIRLFGGYTDNMIFSKYPITNSSYLRFANSPFTETTVLYSRIQAPQGPVNVFCTHLLPANFRIYSYESVNRNQTQQMISYINSTVQNSTEPILAMGDFNSGPSASNNIQGSWTNNYNLFVSNGFQSALIVSNPQPPCTFCSANVLVTNGNPNWIIDHIFVKNAGIINSTVFANYNLVQVNNRLVPLSDHYGVAATLCLTGNFTSNATTSAPGQTTNTVVVIRPSVPSAAPELFISSIWMLIAAFLSLF